MKNNKKSSKALEVTKLTLARLDPAAMRKIKGGVSDPGTGTDRQSKGADCSAVCCAPTEA